MLYRDKLSLAIKKKEFENLRKELAKFSRVYNSVELEMKKYKQQVQWETEDLDLMERNVLEKQHEQSKMKNKLLTKAQQKFDFAYIYKQSRQKMEKKET